MVEGRKSSGEALKLIRKAARKSGWAVKQLPKRGKGSHSIWVVVNESGDELGRVGLTGHSGDMSWTVTRSIEEALEPIFGEGWMDT